MFVNFFKLNKNLYILIYIIIKNTFINTNNINAK